MQIACLGTGSWGFCLASLLAGKGHKTISWTRDYRLFQHLTEKREHPYFPGFPCPEEMHFTTDLAEMLQGSDLIMESVTSAGLRPVLNDLQLLQPKEMYLPIVLTSKGIEQHSGLTLPEVVIEVYGEMIRPHVALLSGPSFASDVIHQQPTSVVMSAYDASMLGVVCDLFNTPFFRVYPNQDVTGVSFGGALKNIIAIACGFIEGLGLGHSAKAAMMTRGLHEIRKLAVAMGSKPETLAGLSGMGDLCLTCGSLVSRNCRFGFLIAQGRTPQEAVDEIGRVVEGAYTCISALELSRQRQIAMPITELVHKVVYEAIPLKHALKSLMERPIKEESL